MVDWERARREREVRAQHAEVRERAGEQANKKLVLGLGCLLLASLSALATNVIEHALWARAALQLAGVGLAVLLVGAVEKVADAPLDEQPAARRLVVRGLALTLMVGPAFAFLAWVLATV